MTKDELKQKDTAQEQRHDEIRALAQIMEEADLSALRIDDGTVKIELERTRSSLSAATLPLMADRVSQLLHARDDASGVTAGAQSLPTAAAASGDELVRSPLIGTFYQAPSPDEEPFVKVGQEVLTGQTLAIVEAMKMMNEITAPCPGIVTEVLAANGSQVEYDQPLFRIARETA